MLVLLLSACFSPIELGISENEWQKLTSEQQQKILDNYRAVMHAKMEEQTQLGEQKIQVNIAGGKAMLPPFVRYSTYTPLKFFILDGECKYVDLCNVTSGCVQLNVCYKNKVLLLDPSLYKLDQQEASLRIYYSPLWRDGFTYTNITTDGYAKLKNVEITLKEIS